MKIEELISKSKESGEVQIGGMPVPVSSLKNLLKEGCDNIKLYPVEKTFSVWGSNYTACLTPEELRQKT
jgi:hypothetical protein